MGTISFTKDDDYSSRKAAIARQEKLAEMLSQMGAQEQAVSTAGGIAAPISGMGALARGLTSFGGSYLSGKAERDAAALDKASRAEAAAAGKALYTLGGIEGGTFKLGEPPTEPPAEPQDKSVLPMRNIPNRSKVQPRDIGQTMPREITLGDVSLGARPYEDQQRMLDELDLSGNPYMARMATGARARIEAERERGEPQYQAAGAGGLVQVNPNAATSVGTVIGAPPVEKTELPNSVREALWYGTATPEEKASFDAAKASGRPVTTIMMPKPENSFAVEFGGGLARNAMTIIETGKKAPSVISSANRVIAALSDPKIVPITGTFAEVKLAVGKALYGDTANYASTEGLMSDLASSTLDAIQGAGLGSGQGFSNTDRQFLELAKAGKVGQTKENLLRLANLRKSAGIAAISMANDVMGKISQMPAYAGLKGLLQPIEANIPEYVTDPKTGQMILKTGR